MDTQQLWKEITDMMKEGSEGRLNDEEREELVEKIHWLEVWIAKGGFIPKP